MHVDVQRQWYSRQDKNNQKPLQIDWLSDLQSTCIHWLWLVEETRTEWHSHPKCLHMEIPRASDLHVPRLYTGYNNTHHSRLELVCDKNSENNRVQ